MKRMLFGSTLLLLLAAFIGPNFLSKSQAAPADVELPYIDQSQYIGSQKCATCHKTYYDR